MAANTLALEHAPVAMRLRQVAEKFAIRGRTWSGTATQFLTILETDIPDPLRRQSAWPKNAQSLANKLRRLAPNLREIGIEIEFDRETTRGRQRQITLQLTNDYRPLLPARMTIPDETDLDEADRIDESGE